MAQTIDDIKNFDACIKKCQQKSNTMEKLWHELGSSGKVPVGVAISEMNAWTDWHFDCCQECQPPDRQHFTAKQKRGLRKNSSDFGGAGAVGCFIGAATIAVWISSPVGRAAGLAVAVVGLGLIAISVAINKIDPSDPNYSEVPVPKFPKLPPVRPIANSGLTASVADAANAVIASQAQAIGFLNAQLTALERSAGAADAGDSAAERRQLKAARDFAKSLAEVFKRSGPLRTALASEWTGRDLNVSISKSDALRMREDIIINGFPSPVLKILKKLEPNRKKRDALEKEAMVGLVQLPSQKLLTSFQKLLRDAKLRAAEVQAASTFKEFSQSH
jgi:hypothetical protein